MKIREYRELKAIKAILKAFTTQNRVENNDIKNIENAITYLYKSGEHIYFHALLDLILDNNKFRIYDLIDIIFINHFHIKIDDLIEYEYLRGKICEKCGFLIDHSYLTAIHYSEEIYNRCEERVLPIIFGVLNDEGFQVREGRIVKREK